MNEKWDKQKVRLNKKRMVESMGDIQQAMIEISDIAYHNRNFTLDTNDINKVSDFRKYILNLLNNIKSNS